MRLTLPRLAALAAAGAIGAGGGVGIYSALQGGGTTTTRIIVAAREENIAVATFISLRVNFSKTWHLGWPLAPGADPRRDLE